MVFRDIGVCAISVLISQLAGTGTPAGDPQEAEAISSAFFGKERTSSDSPDADDVLFVGSIKTVVGHTEGTAGIAGLMKASLAVQNGVVPPNLLFDKLSLKVSPFYQHLRIVQEAIPWPKIPSGQPRRVSVNSFGKMRELIRKYS